MDKVFKYFNDFVKGLTGLIMGVLALGIAASLLFGVADVDGNGGLLGLDVIKNIGDVLGQVATPDGGVLGLIVLLIVWGIISK
ncbi:MAG: hypothetical protein HOA52_00395 [Flavobacteriales bacterium]|jgi:hypothetical protein|nr:hypothetical protein [Flavobacteriales bacterium]MBT6807931.1 hypothetical protein [Flavobacteriales bacterium]